jgi:hypothetical protein
MSSGKKVQNMDTKYKKAQSRYTFRHNFFEKKNIIPKKKSLLKMFIPF